MRRTVQRLLAVAAAFILTATAAAQRYEWRDVVQNVTIHADGTVIIDDTRTLWTDGDFGEAFICVAHGPDQQLTLLDGAGAISPGPDATAFTQGCEGGTPGTELVLRNAQRVSERRVRFRYQLDGTVDVYADVVQWYWNPLERGHPGTVNYELTVTAPGRMASPFDAYVHRYANPEEPNVTLSDDRAILSVRFNEIPSGNGVEVRYLMDPTLFTATSDQPMLEELLRDEARLVQAADEEATAVNDDALFGDADLDFVPADTYELNRDVRLPEGSLQTPAWMCNAIAEQWTSGGITVCYAYEGDPKPYTEAFEAALLAAGYRVTDRGRLFEYVRYLKLDHPDWAHTLTVFLGEYPEQGSASAMLVLFPSL